MADGIETDGANYLDGQILIAMPNMQDPRFAKSLVFLCAHSEDGAMGLIVNKRADDLVWNDLFGKLDIPIQDKIGPRPVHYGGPVETGRGFVLHSADFVEDATLVINDAVALTATIDILKAIAAGKGPQRSLLALGYAGWGPGTHAGGPAEHHQSGGPRDLAPRAH